MSLRVIAAVSALLLAVPAAPLAEPTSPGGGVFKQYTCDQKHEICVKNRCEKTGLRDAALRQCLSDCAGRWLKCKGVSTREDAGSAPPIAEPTRK